MARSSINVHEALEAYRRGEGSLAFAARRAGISLREMIPQALAYGLTPKVDPVNFGTAHLDASLL